MLCLRLDCPIDCRPRKALEARDRDVHAVGAFGINDDDVNGTRNWLEARVAFAAPKRDRSHYAGSLVDHLEQCLAQGSPKILYQRFGAALHRERKTRPRRDATGSTFRNRPGGATAVAHEINARVPNKRRRGSDN